MNAWPDDDGDAIERHLQRLRLRSPDTVAVYRCVLRGFQRFVRERDDPAVSIATLQAWLRERVAHWQPHLVPHRARIVDRFLDFLQSEAAIPINPVAQLRERYAQRWSTPIVRALLAADPLRTLEALRPPLRFGSFLGDMLRRHVELMRAIGYRYEAQAARLLRFDRFLQGRPELASQPPAVLLREWAAQSRTLNDAWECEQTARTLERAWRRLDPTVELPPPDRGLARCVEQQQRRPYIYSPQELRLLLDTALRFPSPLAPLRPHALHTMLVLAGCAGLRLGELARLDLRDVDLAAGVLEVRETKFFKYRTLPLTGSVMAVLREYLDARRRAGAPQDGDSGLFWHRQAAGRYSRVMIEKLLVEVLRRAGLKPDRGRRGPRIHDLRHVFVVYRMMAWYRQGIDPQARLPYLATYLARPQGHPFDADVPDGDAGAAAAGQRAIPAAGDAAAARHGGSGMMKPVDLFPVLLRAFFYERLVQQRNVSAHTIRSYRDTWRLFLRFVAAHRHCRVADLTLAALDAREVAAFLQYSECERKVSIGTRNCRLAALHSFFAFVAEREPAAIAQCAEVLRIPTKKAPKPARRDLELHEIEAILEQPDRSRMEGQRDHALLWFLYNTGARIQEALDVRVADVCFEAPRCVRLFGKGRKERICPLWPETVELLSTLLQRQPRVGDERLFVNRYGTPLGASGVRFKLAHVRAAVRTVPTLASKKVSPHAFRHAAAVHLLAAGVDVAVIRSWLGHASLETTYHYAQANLDTKREALQRLQPHPTKKPPPWRRDAGLLAWLESL